MCTRDCVLARLSSASSRAASSARRSCRGHGRATTRIDPKRAVILGLVAAAASGLLYLLSLWFFRAPLISITILLFGRALLGAAESVIITGSVIWGLALVGQKSTGKVIAWVGAAMFGAFAIGAPIGSTLYAGDGFVSIALATIFAPLATLLLAAALPHVSPLHQARPSFIRVMGAVSVPGIGAALSSVGFGAITAFVVLLFAQQGWSRAWLAYTSFTTAFILARLVFGHLPDRIGGAKVALICVLIQAAGLALIWRADRTEVALAGAVLTGIGYSLVYPGLGVEAVRRVPPESRGLAMGAYTAFLDLALGLGTPALGLVAGAVGLGAAFLVSAAAALGAAAVAARLLMEPRSLGGPALAALMARNQTMGAQCVNK